VQDIYDYVALMDYRDHADGGDGLVSHAMDELRYGETIGRPVLLGIETMPNELKKVSSTMWAKPTSSASWRPPRAASADALLWRLRGAPLRGLPALAGPGLTASGRRVA
jgi:hypothetical protein